MSICTGYENTSKLSRRQLLNNFGMGLGGLALADMLSKDAAQASSIDQSAGPQGILGTVHHEPKAKRVIYLFMAGGPSQMDLFDYKPELNKRHGEELPDSVRKGQRLTGMSGNQSSLPMVGSPFKFKQHGQSGGWFSELVPHMASISDDICMINSMYTEAINHGPGVTFMQTGSQIAGRPSIGSWLDYGLGRTNDNLPSFVVMVTKDKGGQPLVSRMWGSGFLPAKHQGILFRAAADPVLYLGNPKGVSRASRRKMLDRLEELHEHQFANTPDAVIQDRIAQYEMGYRMQASIPEATDLGSEPDYIHEMYGEDSRKPGTFAANCLQARRLAERGVKFIQLYHQGWDQHGGLPGAIKKQTAETDRASAALVKDLKMRGLLEDTLVVWGGEFGRTNYCQGKLTPESFGRDHHPRCFSTWMAGGGTKPGTVYGQTDDFCYNIEKGGVHVHDFHANMMHLLGIDHERLTYKFQGRRYRLTDVHGHLIKGILA